MIEFVDQAILPLEARPLSSLPIDSLVTDSQSVMLELTLEELGEVDDPITQRYGDSTDDLWGEMSTGSYEWELRIFSNDIRNAVDEVVRGATSQEEADRLASDYLASMGLSEYVRVTNTQTLAQDGEIVVTGYRIGNSAFVNPDLLLTTLLLTDDNLAPVYASIDVDGGHDIDTSLLTTGIAEADQISIDTLRLLSPAITELLNKLSASGRFLVPGGEIMVSEMLALWARVDFSITPAGTQYTNGAPGMPGAGMAIRNGGDPIFVVSIDNLRAFMTYPDLAVWYILHELAHVTLIGYEHNRTVNADKT